MTTGMQVVVDTPIAVLTRCMAGLGRTRLSFAARNEKPA
jgi:hypothetical protein